MIQTHLSTVQVTSVVSRQLFMNCSRRFLLWRKCWRATSRWSLSAYQTGKNRPYKFYSYHVHKKKYETRIQNIDFKILTFERFWSKKPRHGNYHFWLWESSEKPLLLLSHCKKVMSLEAICMGRHTHMTFAEDNFYSQNTHGPKIFILKSVKPLLESSTLISDDTRICIWFTLTNR